MSVLSIRLTPNSIDKVRQAIAHINVSQETFVTLCSTGRKTIYSRSVLSKMLQGEPVSAEFKQAVEQVLRNNEKLPDKLKLGSTEFLEFETVVPKRKHRDQQETKQEDAFKSANRDGWANIDYICRLHNQLRIKIFEKCGKMRVLKMREPVPTLDVYVNLNIDSSKNKNRDYLYLDNPFANELVGSPRVVMLE